MGAQLEQEIQQRSDGVPVMVRTPGRFFLLLLTWFTLQGVLRVLISPTASLDEAEQLMLTQDWALGYGPQPPLYTWLQATVFSLTGTSIAGLALLKNALLLSMYWLAYLSGRLITGRHEAGIVASLSLFLLPQIAWESQRDLTHSVLASVLALASLYCFLQSKKHERLRWYILLGASLGCGSLAKYNFLVWAAALLLAGVTLPTYRNAVLNWRTALTLTVMLLIVAPHVVWAWQNPERITQTATKFHLVQPSTPHPHSPTAVTDSDLSVVLWSRAAGLADISGATASFIGPLVGIHALLLWPKRKDLKLSPGEASLLGWAALMVGLLLVGLVVAFGATSFKSRWLQPILIFLPVWLAAQYWRLVPLQRLMQVAALAMLAVALAIPGKLIFADLSGREDWLNIPLPELGRELAGTISGDTAILAETPYIAGNLRLAMPERRVVCRLWGDPGTRPLCLAWDGRKSPGPPGSLLRSAEDRLRPGAKIIYFQAPLRHQPARWYSLGILR